MNIAVEREQRLFQRINLHCNLYLRSSLLSGTKLVRVYDFSGGGLGVIGSYEWLKLGKVQLRVYFPGLKAPVIYSGKIIWRRRVHNSCLWQMGIKFDNPATREIAYFLNYYPSGQH
jgi:hypothetical protein